MPLLVPTLVDAILKLTDKTHAGFVGFPVVKLLVPPYYDKTGTNALVAHNWAVATLAFFKDISIPVINPIILGPAQTAFEQAMSAALNAPGALSIKALGLGLDAFAKVLATGLVLPGLALPPLPGTFQYTPLPPAPGTPPPQVTQQAALGLATAIFSWSKTATFTPPAGSPVPWQ